MKSANIHVALFISLTILIFISTSCSGDLYNDSLRKGPPVYSDWKYCFGNTIRTCFDDDPYVTNQGVTEYIDKNSGEKELLMWAIFERSDSVFSMHGNIKSFRVEKILYNFYVRENGKWKIAGQRNLIRNESPKDQNIPLFPKDSVFGKRFIQ